MVAYIEIKRFTILPTDGFFFLFFFKKKKKKRKNKGLHMRGAHCPKQFQNKRERERERERERDGLKVAI